MILWIVGVAVAQIGASPVIENGLRVTRTEHNVAIEPVDADHRWTVHCETDAMTDAKKCTIVYLASTKGFGGLTRGAPFIAMGGDFGRLGICVQYHDFPGRDAMVRIDQGAPISLPDGDCVTAKGSVDRILAGKRWRSRIYEWPNDYPVDADLDIRGLAKAVEVARSELRGS